MPRQLRPYPDTEEWFRRQALGTGHPLDIAEQPGFGTQRVLGQQLARNCAPGHANPTISQGCEDARLYPPKIRRPVPGHAKYAGPGMFKFKFMKHGKAL